MIRRLEIGDSIHEAMDDAMVMSREERARSLSNVNYMSSGRALSSESTTTSSTPMMPSVT